MESIIDLLNKPVRLNMFGRTKFVRVFVILIVIGLIILFFFARHMLLRDQWRTLDVEWEGFSIDHPALLTEYIYPATYKRGANLGYVLASLDGLGWGLDVTIHQIDMENPELIDAVEWGQKIIRGWDATNISTPVEMEIGQGDYPAVMQSYYRGSEPRKAFLVVNAESAFMIEFGRAYEQHDPVIQQMLDSFRLYDAEEREE